MSPLESARTANLGLRKPVIVLALVAVLAGAWISFQYAQAAWTLDPDTAVPLAIWEGVRKYGPGFLTSWAYTPDNWLFSLLPLTSLAYQILGTAPQVVVGLGWAIFIGSVAMTALLAGKVAGARAGLALAVVLSYAGFETLGNVGYLGHPVTHNITMAWALVILLTAVRAVRRGERWAAGLVGLMVFADMVSDPWAGAAIAGPLFLAAGAIAVVRRGEADAKGAAAVAAAVLVGVVAAQTRGLGLLGFLSKHEFAFGGLLVAPSNAYWALRALGHMFNFVPFADPDARAVKVINAAVLILLLGGAVTRCLWLIRRASVAWQLVAGVAIASIGAVMAAFLVGYWPAGLNVGRFFANLYFFGPLLVALAAASAPWTKRKRWGMAFVAASAGLFVITSAASRADVWLHPAPPAQPKEAAELGDFLARHGLTYGYGPYWGTHALIVEPLTAGRVQIRPISFMDGRVRRRPAETSRYWYRPQDEPAGLTNRFLVVRNDGEECPDVEACRTLAVRQFGPPTSTLTYRDMLILVWPQSIAARIAP